MGILLEDKEICAVGELEVGDVYPPALDHYREIARAQLKKVVEYLGNMRTVVYCQEPPDISHVCMSLEIWQALEKEAGIE